MNSKGFSLPLLIIMAIIIGLLVLGLGAFIITNQNSHFPPAPTAEDYENAKKLPKDKCPCWDDKNSVCYPQASCI